MSRSPAGILSYLLLSAFLLSGCDRAAELEPHLDRDSLERTLQGEWSLRSKSAVDERESQERYSDELGSMIFAADSIFLEEDSAGVKFNHRGLFHLDEANRIRVDSISLGDFFLRDRKRIRGIRTPDRWETEVAHDSLWIRASYYRCCGDSESGMFLGMEQVLFLKYPEP